MVYCHNFWDFWDDCIISVSPLVSLPTYICFLPSIPYSGARGILLKKSDYAILPLRTLHDSHLPQTKISSLYNDLHDPVQSLPTPTPCLLDLIYYSPPCSLISRYTDALIYKDTLLPRTIASSVPYAWNISFRFILSGFSPQVLPVFIQLLTSHVAFCNHLI